MGANLPIRTRLHKRGRARSGFSWPGRGTMIEIWLPRVRNAPIDVGSEVPAPWARGKGRSNLLVGDENPALDVEAVPWDFVTKPFQGAALAGRVRALLERPAYSEGEAHTLRS